MKFKVKLAILDRFYLKKVANTVYLLVIYSEVYEQYKQWKHQKVD